MLREINASRANNTASHQRSQSALTKPFVDRRPRLMESITAQKQGETDQRTTGINTSPKLLGAGIDVSA